MIFFLEMAHLKVISSFAVLNFTLMRFRQADLVICSYTAATLLKKFQTIQKVYSLKIYAWIYLYCNCIDVSGTIYYGHNKACPHLFLVTHHELCGQPYFVRRWDHGYKHCKLYPLHVNSNSSMDKLLYNTKSFLAFRIMPTPFATVLLIT